MDGSAFPGPVGVYGKTPVQGDFVRAGVPAGFVGAWDAWLQSTLPQARSFLGHRWQECYYAAPIWRFSLEAGVAGRSPVQGVMMPSVDRVGRAFPLTLVLPVANGGKVGPDSHLAGGPLFAALERIALDTLDENATWNGLVEALQAPRAQEVQSAEPPEEIAPLVSFGHPARCQWSAVWNGRLVRLQTAALPDTRCLDAMLDLSHPVWKVGADN